VKLTKKTTYTVAASSPKRHMAHVTTYCSRTDKRHVAPAATTCGGRHCSQAVGEQYVPPQPMATGATCCLGELATTGCGGRCHMSLGEFAASAQVVLFVNFTRRWSFLTIHSWRWSFLPKIQPSVVAMLHSIYSSKFC
jgi:hypothetical protein